MLKEDLRIAAEAMSCKGYRDQPERWGEPSNAAVAAVGLATFLAVVAAFALEALYMTL